MKTKKFFLSSISLTLLSSSLSYGAIEKHLDEHHVIETDISKEGLTRIAVKGDRIANVFGLAGDFLLEADEDQGQVFIRPQGLGAERPISLTITTEGGKTQDLRLKPASKNPEALVLIEAKAHPHKKIERRPISREDIIELVKACKEGNVPQGFVIRPVDLKEQTGSHIILREIRNEHLVAQTLEITNPSPELIYLNEADYGGERGTIAVSLSKKALKPGERGEAYVVREIY